MTDPVAEIARSAAHQLAGEIDRRLEFDVERLLRQPDNESAPPSYFDLMSCASLVISVAGLAWTIYRDLQKQTEKPPADIIARRIRVETSNQPPIEGVTPTQRDRIIAVVVDVTTRTTRAV